MGPPGGLLLAAGVASLLLGLGVFSRHASLAGWHRGGRDSLPGSRWGRILLSSPFLAGVGATLLFQSSSASLIGLLGLVRAGLLPLTFAFRFVLGANVGTTFVVQALAFDPGWELAGGLVGLGVAAHLLKAVKTVFRSPRPGVIGRLSGRLSLLVGSAPALAGAGLAFLGLELFEAGAERVFSAPRVEGLLRSALCDPLRAWLLGAAMSALASSSAATIAILGRLAQAGEVGVDEALPVLLGQDLGTTADVLLASFLLGGLARKVGLFHLWFNLALSALFLPLGPYLVPLLAGLSPHPARQIAHAHTLFNLLGSGAALALLSAGEKRKG